MRLKVAVALALVFDIVVIAVILLLNLYQQQTSARPQSSVTPSSYSTDEVATTP